MSRSKKVAIYKDAPKNRRRYYWRSVRRVMKQNIIINDEEFKAEKLPKEIVNDYDYSDHKFDMRFEKDKFWQKTKESMTRK